MRNIVLFFLIALTTTGCESVGSISSMINANNTENLKNKTAGAITGLNIIGVGKVLPSEVNIKNNTWNKGVNRWTAEIPRNNLERPWLWQCIETSDPQTGRVTNPVFCTAAACYPNCD